MTGLPWSFHFERNPVRKIQYLSMLLGGPSKWTDDIEFRPLLLIDHETYKPNLLFPDVKPALPHSRDPKAYAEFKTSDGQTWRYRNMLLPMGEGLSTVTEEHTDYNEDGSTKGRIWFTGPVVFPALTEVVAGSETTWMSITPMEIFTCRDGVALAARRASKEKLLRHIPRRQKVVVAGLGLGWILEKVAALKDVKEIVVIEQSKELLDWYGAEMCARTKKVTELVNDDYWKVAAQYPDHFHIIDIWPNLGGAYEDNHFKKPPFRLPDEIDFWAWGYQFGEDNDNGYVLDEDEAISLQLGEDDEGEDDEDE